MTLFIKGDLATFAATKERSLEERLDSIIPLCPPEKKYKGVALRFTLSSSTHNGHPLDLDNLVEPVFSVLVGKKGYFSGNKANILWWYTKKEISNPAGVEIEVSEDNPSININGKEIFKGEYHGDLPKSATSEDLPKWLISYGFSKRKYEGFWIHLIFPERTKIKEIATGTVKSTIDCLLSIVGGKPKTPED
jgi:hypothetical protein